VRYFESENASIVALVQLNTRDDMRMQSQRSQWLLFFACSFGLRRLLRLRFWLCVASFLRSCFFVFVCCHSGTNPSARQKAQHYYCFVHVNVLPTLFPFRLTGAYSVEECVKAKSCLSYLAMFSIKDFQQFLLSANIYTLFQ